MTRDKTCCIIFGLFMSSLFYVFLVMKNNINVTILQGTPTNNKDQKSTATSGIIFKGEITRSFPTEGRKKWDKKTNDLDLSILKNQDAEKNCRKWSVVTTIFQPSEALKVQASLKDWCLVIVGDEKGPILEDSLFTKSEKIFFFDVNKQKDISNKNIFVNSLYWNHFGRKNLGYLFAIVNGAEQIWDFDDDNLLLEKESFEKGYPEIINVHVEQDEDHEIKSFNPYPHFTKNESLDIPPIWPRGLPYSQITKTGKRKLSPLIQIPLKDVTIFQSIANHDPDVDAIYRLTRNLPVYFSSNKLNLLIPENKMSPFNAQATLFSRTSFWMLYLPITVHGRVSDIWRSYLGQTICKLYNLQIVFTEPQVIQHRNPHNYLADLNSEIPLYEKSDTFVSFLLQFVKLYKLEVESGLEMEKIVENLWISAYEREYIEIEDVYMMQLWLEMLISINSKLLLQKSDIRNTISHHLKQNKEQKSRGYPQCLNELDFSFIIVSRNDNYGGSMTGRLNNSIHNIILDGGYDPERTEIIIVEWNTVENADSLKTQLNITNSKIPLIFVKVPNSIHSTIPNPGNLGMFEYRAKNVGARRARGKWLIIVNQDDMFPKSTHEFIRTSLQHNHYYGSDRKETTGSKIPDGDNKEHEQCDAQLLKDYYGKGADNPGFVPHWANLGDLVIIECNNFYETRGNLETNYNFALDSEYYIRLWYLYKQWEGHRIQGPCSIYHQNHAGMGNHPDGKYSTLPKYKDNPVIDEKLIPKNWGLFETSLVLE